MSSTASETATIVDVTSTKVNGANRHTLWVKIAGHAREFGIHVERELGYTPNTTIRVVVADTDKKTGKPIKLALAPA